MHSLKKSNKLAITVFALALFPLMFFRFDTWFVLWLEEYKGANSFLYTLLDAAYPAINYLSNGRTFIVIIVLFFLSGRFFNKRYYESGAALCMGFLVTGIVTQLLKHLIGRARPRLTDNLLMIGPSWKSGHDSFPSGHTAEAFCCAYILSAYYPKYRSVFYLFALVIGIGRLKTPSHFPSDVLAGAVIGFFIGKAAVYQVKRFMSSLKSAKPSSP